MKKQHPVPQSIAVRKQKEDIDKCLATIEALTKSAKAHPTHDLVEMLVIIGARAARAVGDLWNMDNCRL